MKSREKTLRFSGKETGQATPFEWSVSVTRSSIDFMNSPSLPSGCNCDCSGYVRKDADKAPTPEKR